jgi:hypothetical protein
VQQVSVHYTLRSARKKLSFDHFITYQTHTRFVLLLFQKYAVKIIDKLSAAKSQRSSRLTRDRPRRSRVKKSTNRDDSRDVDGGGGGGGSGSGSDVKVVTPRHSCDVPDDTSTGSDGKDSKESQSQSHSSRSRASSTTSNGTASASSSKRTSLGHSSVASVSDATYFISYYFVLFRFMSFHFVARPSDAVASCRTQ